MRIIKRLHPRKVRAAAHEHRAARKRAKAEHHKPSHRKRARP